MENAAHTLFGAALSRGGLDRLTQLALPTCVVAANLPDIDAISIFWGPEYYFRYHRGITHSFVGVLFLSIMLAWMVCVFDRKVRLKRDPSAPPVSFRGLWIVSAVGLLSHLLMDYTNSYGVRPFLPFSSRWYYGDLAYVVDPWLWLILGGCLVISWIFRNVRRQAALGGLIALCIYWLSLSIAHGMALKQIKQMMSGHVSWRETLSESAFPTFAHPFQWRCVVETPTRIIQWRENLLEPKSQFGSIQVLPNAQIPDVMSRIAATDTGKTFLGFVRIMQVSERRENGVLDVTLRDLRFGLSAHFKLDKKPNVLRAEFLGTWPWRKFQLNKEAR